MPSGELAPVMMITLSFTRLHSRRRLYQSAGSVFCNWINSRRGEESWEEEGGRIRSCRVAGYAADLGDVFEGTGVGGLDDELLAEGAEAGFGAGCHAGVCEGVDEPSVFIGRHCCPMMWGNGSMERPIGSSD